jgi:hypothetical protein
MQEIVMLSNEIDHDLAGLTATPEQRLFLQSLRDGGERICVREGHCWRDRTMLALTTDSNVKGNA